VQQPASVILVVLKDSTISSLASPAIDDEVEDRHGHEADGGHAMHDP
jgi:hypothetical protein